MIEQVKINIKEQLRASNMTIQQLCKLMRKDRKYIYRITDEVKLNKIVEIAQYIGCNPSDLLKGL
jgi:DNA-binding Xre family transcriptional regulator